MISKISQPDTYTEHVCSKRLSLKMLLWGIHNKIYLVEPTVKYISNTAFCEHSTKLICNRPDSISQDYLKPTNGYSIFRSMNVPIFKNIHIDTHKTYCNQLVKSSWKQLRALNKAIFPGLELNHTVVNQNDFRYNQSIHFNGKLGNGHL